MKETNPYSAEGVKVEDNLDDKGYDEVTPFKYAITSYGADYTVEVMMRKIEQGDVYVPTFQRAYVWTLKQASRFVESLLLGLPVPGIFLSKDEGNKLLIIDGQQRLRTLQYYYEGVFKGTKREFALRGVQARFEGKTYKELAEEDKRVLDDSPLHATIVRQDQPIEEDSSSIYYVFERLNTGGTLLSPQEIRACIHHGPFNEMLESLNSDPHWRQLYGPLSSRKRDQELVLRFLARIIHA